MTRIIVVGASMGGLRVAEQLRAVGYTDELVVVGEEPHMPYNRPPLSKGALAGESKLEDLTFPLRENLTDVDWKLGAGAASADLTAHTITLADGEILPYDGLVVATGLSARGLALSGLETSRHVIRTVDHVRSLRRQLFTGRRLVVIGAGFIGCEVAATARKLGLTVSVVAPESVPMHRPLGLDLGNELQRRHEAHGVRFHLGRTPMAFEEDRVVLDDQSELVVDVIVEAIGCQPNVSWLEGNGLDLSDGVLCDNNLRVVGAHALVAVGDIARFPNPLFDCTPRRVEHWNIPIDTARRAARTLLEDIDGGTNGLGDFTPMPSFWSDQYDIRVQSYGSPTLGADDIRILDGDLSGDVVVGYHRASTLVGVVALNANPAAMRYRTRIGAA